MRYALSALIALSMMTTAAFAQTKIAVVNPAKILQEMKETKDSNTAFAAEQKAIQEQAKERQAKQLELENQKNQVKPDAPQWAELNKQVVQMRTENEVWLKQADQELTRKFRGEAKRISGKIKDAIAEVAKAKGIELVVSTQSDLQDAEIDRIPLPQLMPALLSRGVFYSADSLDITQEVLAKLDAGYTPSSN